MSENPFHAILRSEFIAASPHMAECGLRVAALDTAGVTLTLPYRDDWLGDAESGRLNPGIVTVLVDSCAGLAMLAHIGAPARVATLDLRIDYLRPAFRGAELHCRARCIRTTPSIAFIHADVWQQREHEPLASAQLVFMRTDNGRGLLGRLSS